MENSVTEKPKPVIADPSRAPMDESPTTDKGADAVGHLIMKGVPDAGTVVEASSEPETDLVPDVAEPLGEVEEPVPEGTPKPMRLMPTPEVAAPAA